MTGQVKEEILCRFGELGVRVDNGTVRIQPSLLRAREFMAKSRDTGYVDVDGNWQTVAVPENGLLFTWCQVPIVYTLDDGAEASVTVICDDGTEQTFTQMVISPELSEELFQRSGRIRRINVSLRANLLFAE